MAIDMKPGKWYGLGSLKMAGGEDGDFYVAIDNGRSIRIGSDGSMKEVSGPNAGLTKAGQSGADDKWHKNEWKMAKGGLVRGCGAAKKGKTRGKMV